MYVMINIMTFPLDDKYIVLIYIFDDNFLTEVPVSTFL